MKNIVLKITLLLFVILIPFGCEDDLEKYYQNPDGFSKEQADAAGVSVIAGYFTSQLTRGYFLRGDYGAMFHSMRSGSPLLGTGMQPYQATGLTGGAYVLRNVENDWGSGAFNQTVFNLLNTQWMTQILWAQAEFNKMDEPTELDVLFMNLLAALKSYAYQRAIDLYDKVPYFETGSAGGLEGDRAQWLGQEQIYPIIIEELKEIEEYLATVNLSDQQQSIFSRQDVIFNGNIMQWRKYLNSLRLRWAITVSEMRPDLTQSVLSELSGKPLFDQYNDVAGLADIAIVAPHRLTSELGITRGFRERHWEHRAPAYFLHDVMGVVPNEQSIEINGETLYYFDGDNVTDGLLNGTVDPRVAYLFSASINGNYTGVESAWEDGTDPNSYLSKVMRSYYINHPIMTDIDVHSITIGSPGHEHTINLNEAAQADLSEREPFLLNYLRLRFANSQDTQGQTGSERSLVSEYNVRPRWNWDIRFPTLHAVEVALLKAEASVRGLGPVQGSAREYYRQAIEMSSRYWYEQNVNNRYNKSTTPAMPGWFADSRLERDRPAMQYDASAFAEHMAQQFDAMTNTEKMQAIFDQLHLHYNHFNFETVFTSARRLINYIGDNPANIYETLLWKERNLYNPNVQATDPDAWALISVDNDYNKPVWFTGRSTKWRNVLE